MRRKKNGIYSLILAVLLTFSLVMPASATDLQKEIDEAEAHSKELESQKQSAEAQIDQLNAQLTELNETIEKTQAEIDAKVLEIKEAEEEYVQAKIEEDRQYDAMKLRIRYMYEYAEDNTITAILSAESLSDLINRTEYVGYLTSYDREMLNEFVAIREEIEEREAKLQEEYDELTAMQDELTAEQTKVQECMDAQASLVAQLEEELGANAQKVSDLKAELDEYNKKAQAAAAAAAAAAASGDYEAAASYAGESMIVGNGQFCNPCPNGRLSSDFGYRTFDNSFHKGIDLACNTGNPVYAAYDGKVIIACRSASAGNWIVINHGNGLVTKYMHNSAIYVSAGQTVTKGQNIAAVGSTGYSTGPHLHFQVEVNGQAVSPWSYL